MKKSRPLKASFIDDYRYLFHHAIQSLLQKKLGTLLTVLVISITLTIPITGYLLWSNVHQASLQFSPEPRIALYLHKHLSEKEAQQVVNKIKQQTEVEEFTYISRQQSLQDFKAWSGLNEALDLLDDNPLPAVILIKVSPSILKNATHLDSFKQNMLKIKGVQEVRVDEEVIKKLSALSKLMAHIAILCSFLMIIGVILVIGNTIRSEIYSHQETIEVMKLMGATNYFIIRPYLLMGMIYALLGGVLATFITCLIIFYFNHAIKDLAEIFMLNFKLTYLNHIEMVFLLIMTMLIGYFAAWIVANQHIKIIDLRKE